MNNSNSKYTFKKIVAAGCLTFVVGALGIVVLVNAVYIPEYEHQQRARVCWTSRRYILDQEELFKQHSPTHQYTTNLQKLNLTASQGICPEDGVYSVVIKDDHIQVNCSIPEHNTPVAK